MITQYDGSARQFVDVLWELGYRYYDGNGYFRDEHDNEKQDKANAYKLAALVLKEEDNLHKSDYIAQGRNCKRYPDLMINVMTSCFAEQRDAKIELLRALQDDVLEMAQSDMKELFEYKFASVIQDSDYNNCDYVYESARDMGEHYASN